MLKQELKRINYYRNRLMSNDMSDIFLTFWLSGLWSC